MHLHKAFVQMQDTPQLDITYASILFFASFRGGYFHPPAAPLLLYQAAHLSRLCRTGLALLRASSLKILIASVTFAGIMLQCCCSSFLT